MKAKDNTGSNNPPTTQDILGMINSLSDRHVLKSMPPQYAAGFANAAVNVYDPTKIRKILQQKFYIPNEANFTEDAYLQSAAELSVSNHVRNAAVFDFETEKRVNPANKKDVDVYYRVGSTKVCIEVKCPIEEQQEPLPTITLSTAGRLPDHRQSMANVKTALSSSSSLKIIDGKNRDLRLKEALLGAHQKFKPNPEIDELNVLFLACGDFYKMSEWHGYLLGQGGLFTGNPFHPPATFCNVDCLILSNVKYRHQVAFNFPAWSLVDVFMVPLQNPHRRKNVFDSTVAEGLSVFKHYGKEFFADRIVRPGAEEIQEMIAPQTKVTWFVDRHLNTEEKKRFFPAFPRQGTIPAP